MAKILLVEDDDLVRDMLAQTLKNASHEVLTACDGEEALEKLQKNKFDLMITDLIMPKKNGMLLITEIHNQHQELKIISISGGGRLDPVGYLDLSESLGASLSFEKPVDNDALLMAIDLLLLNTLNQ